MSEFKDERYNRQIVMPEWGKARQERLTRSSVVVIGAGGVKTTLLTALVATGVGKITIIEDDIVELSNLNRQTLYAQGDIGRKKGDVAREKLTSLNPTISIKWIDKFVDKSNVDELLAGYDYIVEGGSSPAGRNLINEYCLKNLVPYTHASAQYNYGYCFSVLPDEKSACFACFFPDDHVRKESTGAVPVSVLSTQIAGSLGATEVVKYLMGYGDKMIVNKAVRFSSLLLSEEFELTHQKRIKDCAVCSRYY